jgi:thiol-disulfide isomerase/thioredoxin
MSIKLRRVAPVAATIVLAVTLALGQAGTPPPKDPALIDAQGYTKLVQQYKGKPLLVTFWATWCEPCRDEYPMLNELAKRYAPQGLKVVGVDLDQDGDLILMRRFLARYKPIFPNYRKKQGGEDAFVQAVLPGWNGSIPASVFYAKDGTQIGNFVGAGSREKYQAAIQMLLSKP